MCCMSSTFHVSTRIVANISHQFSFNSSLGLVEGKHYQKITIPNYRLVLQNFALPGCFAFIYCNVWFSFTEDTTTSFIIPHEKGGYVISQGRRIVALNWDTKDVTTLAEIEEIEGVDNRLNDGKCDPSGRLWTGG